MDDILQDPNFQAAIAAALAAARGRGRGRGRGRRGRGRGRGRGGPDAGQQFSRMVVLLPGPFCSNVPRGRVARSMRDQGLMCRVLFDTGMSVLEVRETISAHFRANRHLEDRTSNDFEFCGADPLSNLRLLGLQDQNVSGDVLRGSWRSNRPLYVRPFRRLTTYNEHVSRNGEQEENVINIDDLQDDIEHGIDDVNNGRESDDLITDNSDGNGDESGSENEVIGQDQDVGNVINLDDDVQDQIEVADDVDEQNERDVADDVDEQNERDVADDVDEQNERDDDLLLNNSGVIVDFHGHECDLITMENLSYLQENEPTTAGTVSIGPGVVSARQLHTDRQGRSSSYSRAQEFWSEISDLCALPATVLLIPLRLFLLQLQIQMRIGFILVTNRNPIARDLEWLQEEETVRVLETGLLWGRYTRMFPERLGRTLPGHLFRPSLVVLCPTLGGNPEVRATIDLSNVTQDRIQVAEAEARLALTTNEADRERQLEIERRENEADLQHLVGDEGEGEIRVRLRGREATFQRRFTASDTNELLYQVAIANVRERNIGNITIRNASGRIVERNDDPIDVVDATTLMVFHD
ncbi:predicted protein [Nematostella vectensis]|uniref:Uncharacterized protein n=1 Tax=Nematostella vectensis TaxID=45351 RepID=A7SR41_NEMVE|nr:predicted protein [Nematostella vectensis]|eukprot:XP_001625929.1 predicted protein [Nematostella vectensis]